MNLNKNEYGIVERVTGCTKAEWNRMQYFANRDDGDELVFSNGDKLVAKYDKSQFAGDLLLDRYGNLMQYSRSIGYLRYWASGLLWNESFVWDGAEIPALSEYMYDDSDFVDSTHESTYLRAKHNCVESEKYYVALRVHRNWDYEYEHPELEGDERGEFLKLDTYTAHAYFNNIYHNLNVFHFNNNEINQVVARHAPSELLRQFHIEDGDGKWDDVLDDRVIFVPVKADRIGIFEALLTALRSTEFFDDLPTEYSGHFDVDSLDFIMMGSPQYRLVYGLLNEIVSAISEIDDFYDLTN